MGAPLAASAEARAWLRQSGEGDLDAGIAILNRALHAYRLVTADPYLGPVARGRALVARIGYGAGEQVADGLWTEARELPAPERRPRRYRLLQPEARLAAILTGSEVALTCENLSLGARLDLDQGRDRAAALQLRVALESAVAELTRDPSAPALADRLAELRALRGGVDEAAEAALAGELRSDQRQTVAVALGRLEAALRARAVAGA